MKFRFFFFALVLWFLGPALEADVNAQSVDAQIDAAIKLNRSGKTEDAVTRLVKILEEHPENNRARIDLAVIYAWSGREEKTIKLLSGINNSDLKNYALSARARAERATGRFDNAASIYRVLLERNPRDDDAFAGLLLSLADDEKEKTAISLLEVWESKTSATYPVKIATAYVYDKSGRYLDALFAYQRANDIQPSSREARRGIVFMLEKVGGHSAAFTLAKQSSEDFSNEELGRLHLNLVATHIRFNRTYEPRPSKRYRWADLALSELEGNQSTRARVDRLVALHDHQLMTEVIQEFEALQTEGTEIPNYAKTAVAGAYLFLQQPEKSKPLYRAVYESEPGNISAGLGLFYTLVELERIDEALSHIAELDKITPRFVEYRGAKSKYPNPGKVGVLNTWAISPLFNNDLELAQARIENLNDRAGGNTQFQISLAEIFKSRGWPKRAYEQAKIAQSIETESTVLNVLVANIEQDLRRYDASTELSEQLTATYPENRQVQRLNRRLEIHNMRELVLSFNAANSNGSTFGSSSGDIEARVYSAPFKENWRSFVDGGFATADFEEGRGQLFDGLVGLDFRSEHVFSEIALGYASGEKEGLKGKISADYIFDDHWSVGGSAELFSDETPLRAVKNDVKSDSITLRSSYRISESLRFDGAIGFSDFDDGNERFSGYLSGAKRVYSSAGYIANLSLALYGSDNSLENAAYYNPEQDFSAAIDLENQFLLYRRYDTAFWNDVSIDVGPYWQKNFGASTNYSGTYQHRWQWDELYELSYGVSLASRVYDGDRELELSGFGRLALRF